LIFDPSRWPAREAISRVLGVIFVALVIARRVLQLPDWPGYIAEVRGLQPWFAKLSFLPQGLLLPPFDLELRYTWYGYSRPQILTLWSLELLLWIVETTLLLGYAVVWLTRPHAKGVAKGFLQTAFPLILVLLPFGIVLTPYTYNRWLPEKAGLHLAGLYAINTVLIAAGALNMVGLVAMRKSFAIMAEARVLVRSGPYRWVRHPMYLAHFVIFLCVMLLRFSPVTLALYVVFIAGQIARALIEERKLLETFPEYAEYRSRTGMFLPKRRGGIPKRE
jgi:protein-S-isoprenylcysteine O-methyltransferase Ste14